jgi:hypothetical protein
MKAFLLTAAAFLILAGGVQAQNLPPEYLWEVGLNGGSCAYTRPSGPALNYQGNRTNTQYDYSVRLNYYFSSRWMINLDLGSTRWLSYSNWAITDLYGQALGSREITFLVANRAVNESVGMNFVLPFYTRYNTFNRANINFGVQFGLMQTVNDGSLHYSLYRKQPDSALSYMSKYDYAAGTGFTYGVQAGFTYYILPRVGINLDLAARYARVKTNDQHYGSENNHYYLLYFPETIGVRWRF